METTIKIEKLIAELENQGGRVTGSHKARKTIIRVYDAEGAKRFEATVPGFYGKDQILNGSHEEAAEELLEALLDSWTSSMPKKTPATP